ncbi:MAG: DNA repair protein RadC [Bacteroidota bacterium]
MGEYLKITDWALEDRPREKLAQKGRNALSDAELIAILIGSGTKSKSAVDVAKEILKKSDNDLNELAKKSIKDLTKVEGIGEAKAITIASALELGRRRKSNPSEDKPQLKSSEHAYELMKPHLLDLQHEEFWLINLNRANKVISKTPISSGGVTGTIVDPKMVFKTAINAGAVSIILVHNHPSDNLKPSNSDLAITKKLVEAGKFLELQVLDHLIFTNEGYFSFADSGKLS